VATIVVLNGTSSAGKTAIARAFQERAGRIFLNFSIDSILSTLPLSALERIKRREDISDLRFQELVRAFFACVKTLADLGHDLVIDHAITTQAQADWMSEAVRGHQVLLVAVDCPAEVLAERERQRGDRPIGVSAAQFDRVHQWLTYDLRIDSSTASPPEAAAAILAALAERRRSGNTP
jgi:chloramphenicol 3-O phosphotransferase